jgi:hypothetical protein
MGHGKDIQERVKKISDKQFLDQVVGRCSGISYTYRDCIEPIPGLRELPGPAIGDRAPDVDFPNGGTLFDLTRHAGFTLLVVPGSGPGNGMDAAVTQLHERFGRVIHPHRLQRSAALQRQYGDAIEDRVYLIRPDGYIGFRGTASELPSLAAHLDSFLMSKN